jgi:hypothetical protein
MDPFIESLPQATRDKISDELITSSTQLAQLPDPILQGLGLKLGDILRLRPPKRPRNQDDEDDPEDRQVRDTTSRAQNTINLMESGVLCDPFCIASLCPKNWVQGIDHIFERWRPFAP